MKVIALTGEKQACERFLETLAHQGSVATITCGKDEGGIFSRTVARRVLRIQSPSSCVVHLYTSGSAVRGALDRLAEQGDVR